MTWAEGRIQKTRTGTMVWVRNGGSNFEAPKASRPRRRKRRAGVRPLAPQPTGLGERQISVLPSVIECLSLSCTVLTVDGVSGYLAPSATVADLPASLSHVRDGGDTRRMSGELRHSEFTFSRAVNVSHHHLSYALLLYTLLLMLPWRLVT